MKSKLIRLTLLLALFLSVTACASIDTPPALERRSLRVSRSVPGFEYQYRVCRRMFLGSCVSSTITEELYDLRDEKVREKLINMGFVAKVRVDVLKSEEGEK